MDSPRFLINKKDGLTPDILISRGLNGSLHTVPSYLYPVYHKVLFSIFRRTFFKPVSVFCHMTGESLNTMQSVRVCNHLMSSLSSLVLIAGT